MLRRRATVFAIAMMVQLPLAAEPISVNVHGGTPAGTLSTYFEPSAFFGWTSTQMKIDFAVDAGSSRGLIVESTHLILTPSTSLANYQTRLAQSGLATVAALAKQQGAQFLLQIHGMPLWISSSSVTSTPPGCTEEWPKYQTVAPDPAKWADWEAAIAATVTFFNVTHGLDNVWYQFWEEPDGPCFWTDTQANFLETWRHFVVGARSADPNARVGGPEPAGGPESIKPGESVPVMQAFIEYSAAQGIQLDFITYHLFGSPPEQNGRASRQVLDLLNANGFSPLPILVGSWNPLSACFEPNEQRDDPSWPSPPSPLGCWQTDNEMGASYSLAFMAHLAASGTGYQAMYQLDDADWGGSLEFPHDWGLRTNKNKNGLRKAIYHAQTIIGRMPRQLVSVDMTHADDSDEYFPHVWALAGVDGNRLGLLLWSYVTSPGRQAVEVLRDMGYGPADFQRWGGQPVIAAFLANVIPVSTLTTVPSEQVDLERMKEVFYRQRALVTQTSDISLSFDGFPSAGGYEVKRWLIDSTHNNSYAAFAAGGLSAAIGAQGLQQLDTQLVSNLAQIPDIDLPPYAVMFAEITRGSATGGCSNPSVVADARLKLRKLKAPAGDDQFKLRGTISTPASPPVDPRANGMRIILTDASGFVLADLIAPAGSRWSRNAAGTTWKYRDSSALTGITKMTVREVAPAGTFKINFKAAGLTLASAVAGAPVNARVIFGNPTAAPGQCGATAFAACRASANGSTVRCP